ncbi:MAG: helix-turn-helix transcriptional regulator, partial [Acidobacteriaceae bacterium]
GGEGAPAYAPDGLLTLRGLSVERLARASNITRTAVYFYIDGKCRPRHKTLLRMCQVLEVPYDEGAKYCTPATTGRPRQSSASLR